MTNIGRPIGGKGKINNKKKKTIGAQSCFVGVLLLLLLLLVGVWYSFLATTTSTTALLSSPSLLLFATATTTSATTTTTSSPLLLQQDQRRQQQQQEGLTTMTTSTATDSSSSSSSSVLEHLIIMRHGDRWDYQDRARWNATTNKRNGDPPLSRLGMLQARQAGEFLHKYLSSRLGVKPEETLWLSSPFLRCLQTANQALNGMGSDYDQTPLRMENAIFEYDSHQHGLWHQSLPSWNERGHYFPRLTLGPKQTLEDQQQQQQLLFTPTLPESQEQFLQRCRRVVTELPHLQQHHQHKVIVLVTHAACSVGLVHAATGLDFGEFQPAAPTSLFHLQLVDKSSWQLRLDGSIAHLQQPLGNTTPWSNFGDTSNPQTKGYSGPWDSPLAPPHIQQLHQKQQQQQQAQQQQQPEESSS